jgi:hypothetical protein
MHVGHFPRQKKFTAHCGVLAFTLWTLTFRLGTTNAFTGRTAGLDDFLMICSFDRLSGQ